MARAKKTEEQPADLGIDFRVVPIDHLEANDYNPNEVEAELFETLLSTVRDEGMNQPILVRPKPDTEDRFIIVDGENRWKAANLAGLDRVAVIVVNYDETQAKLRTLSFNAVRGNNVPIKLARLVVDLQKTLSDHEIAAMTGIPSDEQQSVLKLLDIGQHRTDDGVRLKRTQPKEHVQVNLLLMPEQHAAYTTAIKVAINIAGESTTALIGREVDDYNKALSDAMGISGVKLRNVALAVICDAFNHMPDDLKKDAAKRMNKAIMDKRASDAKAKQDQAQRTDKVIVSRTMKKRTPAKP